MTGAQQYRRPVSTMSLPEIRAELRSYQPQAGREMVNATDHLQRRADLWQRLDVLVAAARRTAR